MHTGNTTSSHSVIRDIINDNCNKSNENKDFNAQRHVQYINVNNDNKLQKKHATHDHVAKSSCHQLPSTNHQPLRTIMTESSNCRIEDIPLQRRLVAKCLMSYLHRGQLQRSDSEGNSNGRYQILEVVLKKNLRGLGLSITGGIDSLYKPVGSTDQSSTTCYLHDGISPSPTFTTGRSSPSSPLILTPSPTSCPTESTQSRLSSSISFSPSPSSNRSNSPFILAVKRGGDGFEVNGKVRKEKLQEGDWSQSNIVDIVDVEGKKLNENELHERRDDRHHHHPRHQYEEVSSLSGTTNASLDAISPSTTVTIHTSRSVVILKEKGKEEVVNEEAGHSRHDKRDRHERGESLSSEKVVVGVGGHHDDQERKDEEESNEHILRERLISIKKVFPAEPAFVAGLQAGDIILEANGLNMVGLTNVEAVNLLHSFKDQVRMRVLRFLPQLPSNQIPTISSPTSFHLSSISPSSSDPTNHCPDLPYIKGRQVMESEQKKEVTRENLTNFSDGQLSHHELHSDLTSRDMVMSTPSPILDSFDETSLLKGHDQQQHINPPQFDVTLKKKDGSLGFTIVKKDDGIYVKDIIKDPALTDGNVRPGDKILRVNGIDVSSLSHSGAISFLRGLPDVVNLKIQPHISTDDSHDMSSYHVTSDGFSSLSKKQLRHEARMMIKDKGNNNFDSLSRLKMRKDKSKTRVNGDEVECCNQSQNDTGHCTTITVGERERKNKEELGKMFDEKFYTNLVQKETEKNNKEKPYQLTKSQSSDDGFFTSKTFNDEISHQPSPSSPDIIHRKSIPHRIESGYIPSPTSQHRTSEESNESSLPKPSLTKWRGTNLVDHIVQQSNHHRENRFVDEQDSGFGDSTPKATTLEKPLTRSIVEVTLEKGWTSRLGIQLMDDASSEPPNCCVVKGIVPHTIAASDGRIKEGFKLMSVNDIALEGKPSKEVIDYIRKFKGKMKMKFLTP